MISHSSIRSWVAPGIIIASTLLLAACSSSDDNTTPDTSRVTFIVPLSADQEVPAVTAPGASGEGNIELVTETGALSGSVAVSGLTGPVQMAHIHQGFAGSNGPVIVGLTSNAQGTVWSVPADTVLDTPTLAALNAGEMYINVHTEQNPGGELRGQILPATVRIIRTLLSGQQEVPPVTTTATATGAMTFNTSSNAITAIINTTGLDDATMAHIHNAPAGENGPVIIGLEQDAADVTVWRTASETVLDEAGVAALDNDALYYNVHTPLNPPGEVRGQLLSTDNAANATEFTVRIDNVSTTQTLPTSTGSVAVPLSPGAYLVHRANRNPLLDPRDPSSPALEALAEDGDPSQFPAAIAGAGVFNTPVGASEPGPLLPGNYYSFTFTASPGDALAIATMFVQSNDWFYSTTDNDDDSISLFDADGNPVTGDVTDQLSLWESGTEVDEEPGTGPNQAPRQPAPNTGDAEGLTVGSLAGRGKSVELNGSVIRVTISTQ